MPQIPLSPRRRRLRRTIRLLVFATVAGLALTAWISKKSRPKPYSPGEADPDITSRLTASLPPDAPRWQWHDITASAGLGEFRTFAGERTSQLPEDMGPGAAWGDYDNDGDDDLFLVSAGAALTSGAEARPPCVLFENLGDGTFRQQPLFPELRIQGMAAAWGDYNGDGWPDLAIAGYDALLLFRNDNGTGRFIQDDAIENRAGFWASVAWGDFDNDRDLDLYVCGYVRYVRRESDLGRGSDQLGTFVPYTLNPASYEPELNLLFVNHGAGRFAEAARELNVANPTGRSLGALWHDFDDDGWLDLYVANDISDNAFYRNLGGTFEEQSHAAWISDYRSAMGLAAGDWDRDGDDDLFITHWVAQENAFYENLWADYSAQASASNSVRRLRFMDISDRVGLGQIALPFVGWGAEFADLDGDGWLDLAVANGSTIEISGTRQLKPQAPFLFWNRRGQHFHNLAPALPAFQAAHVSRGLALADPDGDGDLDLLFVHLGSGVQLLENRSQTGNWATVRLRNRLNTGAWGDGAGTRVTARAGDVLLRRSVTGASYISQSTRMVHFGLGSASKIDRLEVHWLGGETEVFTDLAANSSWRIDEGGAVPVRLRPGRSSPAHFSVPSDPRERVTRFWASHRAGMDALKGGRDAVAARRHFEEAIALDPRHEDARYYLSHCLAATGDVAGALVQLDALIRINARSHRGLQQWGRLRALSASRGDHLRAAEERLQIAHQINPEETGVLALLGEIHLMRDRSAAAEPCFRAVRQTNPKSTGSLFLLGYIAWKRDETAAAAELLARARESLGPDWKPAGTTAEGDAGDKWHEEPSPLAQFWERWDGATDPARTFMALDSYLSKMREPQPGIP